MTNQEIEQSDNIMGEDLLVLIQELDSILEYQHNSDRKANNKLILKKRHDFKFNKSSKRNKLKSFSSGPLISIANSIGSRKFSNSVSSTNSANSNNTNITYKSSNSTHSSFTSYNRIRRDSVETRSACSNNVGNESNDKLYNTPQLGNRRGSTNSSLFDVSINGLKEERYSWLRSWFLRKSETKIFDKCCIRNLLYLTSWYPQFAVELLTNCAPYFQKKIKLYAELLVSKILNKGFCNNQAQKCALDIIQWNLLKHEFQFQEMPLRENTPVSYFLSAYLKQGKFQDSLHDILYPCLKNKLYDNKNRDEKRIEMQMKNQKDENVLKLSIEIASKIIAALSTDVLSIDNNHCSIKKLPTQLYEICCQMEYLLNERRSNSNNNDEQNTTNMNINENNKTAISKDNNEEKKKMNRLKIIGGNFFVLRYINPFITNIFSRKNEFQKSTATKIASLLQKLCSPCCNNQHFNYPGMINDFIRKNKPIMQKIIDTLCKPKRTYNIKQIIRKKEIAIDLFRFIETPTYSSNFIKEISNNIETITEEDHKKKLEKVSSSESVYINDDQHLNNNESSIPVVKQHHKEGIWLSGIDLRLLTESFLILLDYHTNFRERKSLLITFTANRTYLNSFVQSQRKIKDNAYFRIIPHYTYAPCTSASFRAGKEELFLNEDNLDVYLDNDSQMDRLFFNKSNEEILRNKILKLKDEIIDKTIEKNLIIH